MKQFFLLLLITFSLNAFAQTEYDKLVEEGLQLLIQQNISAAIEKYGAAYKIDSTKVEANYGLGVAYQEYCSNNGSHCFLALNYLNKAIEIDNSYRNCYYNRGNLKNMMLDYKGAIKDLDISVKRKPDDKNRYLNLAFAYNRLSDHTNECNNLHKAAQLNSNIAKKKLITQGCE